MNKRYPLKFRLINTLDWVWYAIRFRYSQLKVLLTRLIKGTQCGHEGCNERHKLVACYLDVGRAITLFPPDFFLCRKHALERGFCAGCGLLWGDVPECDLHKNGGYCDACAALGGGESEE